MYNEKKREVGAVWKIIRVLVSLFLCVEFLFSSVFSGAVPSCTIEMPEKLTSEYTSYVDPFTGTGGTPWTAGMLSPAACVPFGLVRLGPDTCGQGGLYLVKTNTSGYYYEHRHILGFSYSRLSGTGIRDYGMFRVTPGKSCSDRKPAALIFSHNAETASPGYYEVYLPGTATMCEMTATEHAGYQRYTFDSPSGASLFIDAGSHLSACETEDALINIDSDNCTITAEVTVKGEFSSRYGGMKAYYYAETDRPFDYSFCSDDKSVVKLDFGNIKGESVTLRAGISFVSVNNAENNLYSEAGNMSFDEIRRLAGDKWNERLSAIKVEADEEIKRIFYTSYYHTMIMPTEFSDCNGEYVGFDKQIHTSDGFVYRTDMSLWDTCRNVNALYILTASDVQKDCLKSLADMADRGGVLPRWPMGEGYTGSMLGCPANIVFSESYLKGFDIDTEKIYRYMKKSAETFDNEENREYAEYYDEYGYVPDDLVRDSYRGLSVSRTLEYAWADSVIAMFADELGYAEDAALYRARSKNYRNVWDDSTKYFRARNSDGSWGPLKPELTAFYDDILGTKFSKAYCEGSARQWRWSVLNDIDGMIELFGSDEYFVSELEAFMSDASFKRADIDPGSGFWIGNQHDIHTPYLFNDAGRPDLTQKWVRWTLDNRFSCDIDGLDGNDDGGTLSAWYVFSAMGFYPVAGTAEYWLGSPCIESAEITMSGGSVLTVKVNNQGKNHVYVDSVYFNGEPVNNTAFTHSMIENGGELVFNMK